MRDASRDPLHRRVAQFTDRREVPLPGICFTAKVGSKTSTRSGTSLTANRAAGSFAVKAVVGKSAFVKGTSYVVTLVAKAPDGRKSTLTVTFKG